MLTGACKAGERDREVEGRKKQGQGRRGSGDGEKEVWRGRLDYENVFIWPMTDGRCCQPGSGSHRLTVTEA